MIITILLRTHFASLSCLFFTSIQARSPLLTESDAGTNDCRQPRAVLQVPQCALHPGQGPTRRRNHIAGNALIKFLCHFLPEIVYQLCTILHLPLRCRQYFQHAHSIPIVGVGKRGAYYLVRSDLPRQHPFGTTLRFTGPVPADSRQGTPSVRNCVTR